MKLKELLSNIEFEMSSNVVNSGALNHKTIELIKEQLLKCDEFKNVTNLTVLQTPNVENETGEVIKSKSYKLVDDIEFSGDCYIYGIMTTPPFYDEKTFHDPVKNGACITPTVYDAKTLIPKKKICIEFSPEGMDDDLKKEKLRNVFNDVLNSPEQYQQKGEVGYMIRGIFEEIKSTEGTFKNTIGKLNLDYDNQSFFSVYYLKEKTDDNGDMTLSLETKFLPSSLCEKFKSTFTEMVTEDELNEFLKVNNSEYK